MRTVGRSSPHACALLTNAVALLLGIVATATPASAQVTFTKDVAPILQRSCQNCHRPGSIAPMSLLTYEDARPWARSIKQRVEARQMPPWHVDRTVGIRKFKDDPSLTDQEIATLVRVGGRRRAARQSGRHAAAAPVRRRGSLAHRQTRSDRVDAEVVHRQDRGAPTGGASSTRTRA